MSGRKSVRTHPPHFLTFVLGGWNWSHNFHAHKNAHIAQPPGVATIRAQSKNPPAFVPAETRSERSAFPCWQLAHLSAATSGRSRKCSYGQWQADRLQMCTCQINKCYKVNNAFIWINFTVSVWENSGKTIHHHKCFFESYYQQMLLAQLGCCCQWPAVCFISMIEMYICTNMHTNTQSPTHTPSAFKQNQKPKTVCCSCRMIGVTSQNFLHHGQ